jgi:phospholipid-transporting ATPase
VDDIGDVKSSNKKTSPFFEMFLSSVQYLLTLHFILPFNWFGLMEIAYFILSYFIIWDSKVRLNKRDKTEIINSNCLADFGQVKHILTDKTGTLTKRKFHLKACSIRGKMYSFDNLEQKDENYVFKIKNNDLKNLEIYQEMHSNSKFSNNIKEFMEKLSLCHSVRVTLDDDEKKVSNKKEKIDEKKNINNINSNKSQIIYASSFAEEKSMLKTFRKLGYKIEKTLNYSTRLNIDNEIKEYQILGRNKFSEERKRMSILVKNLNDNGSCLLCKANDLTIFKLIKKTQNENEINKTRLQIKEMTKFGYRYFIFCYKNLNEEETISFMTKYKSAENYVVKSEEHLRNLAIEYEVNMNFLGVLFFEEKMDRDLKFSINKLNNAGIKVWIVSGDKRDNVLSVGKNLNLFNPKSILGDFSDKDKPEDLDIKMSML